MSDLKYFHLTIVRHGETDENKNKIIQGQMETNLSDIGLLQAKETGDFFKNVPIDLIYCSDLKRTCQTANEIAIRNEHIMKNKNSPVNSIIKSSTIRERSFGVYTGYSLTAWRNECKSKERSSKSWVPPNGESINQLRDRAIHSFADLCQIMLKQQPREACDLCPITITGGSKHCQLHRAQGDLVSDPSKPQKSEYLGHLLLMSHGGFINQLLQYLSSISLHPVRIEHKNIPNCSITQLSVIFNNKCKSAKVDFHSINFIDHLTSDSCTENV